MNSIKDAILRNREKLLVVFLDRLVIGLLLLGVALAFQQDWHNDRLEFETERSKHQLQLDRSDLAAQILPKLTDSDLDADHRSFLLSSLILAEAITPASAANLGQMLLEEGVSESHFSNALKASMLADVRPFIMAAQPVVRSVRLHDILAEPLPHASSLLRKWESAFSVYVLTENQPDLPAFAQLNNQSFLADDNYHALNTGRFHTLAYLLTPNPASAFSRQYAHNINAMIQSNIFAMQYIGHAGRLAHTSGNLCLNGQSCGFCQSHRYISDRIGRSGTDDSDSTLLSQEIRILSDTRNIYGKPLKGDIAVTLAKQFTASDHPAVRFQAYKALRSMDDHGIQSERHFSNFVDSLTHQADASRVYRIASRDQVAEIAKLALDMRSLVLIRSLERVFAMPSVRHQHPAQAQAVDEFLLDPTPAPSMLHNGYGCGIDLDSGTTA